MKPHLSDYQLDRLHAGDLTPDALEQARAHLQSCEQCRKRAQEIDQYAQRLFSSRSPEHFAERLSAHRSPRMPLWMGVAALAAVSAGLLLVWILGLGPKEPTTRIKGEVELVFFVQEDGQGRPGVNGETLRQGDRIRFSVFPGAMSHVFVVSLTDEGALTPWYPEDWSQSIVVEAGRTSMLPDSVILDDHKGAEVVLALFSPKPLIASDVRAACQKVLKQLHSQGKTLRELSQLPLPTDWGFVWFVKE